MFIPLHDANALKHIRLQYVTLVIIVANCAIWLAMGTPAFVTEDTVRATVYSFGFIPAVVNGLENLAPELQVIPELATYVTYAFFHGDFLHLAGNMLFIWVFGDNVEDAMGHFKYLLFYLACAAAAAWTHAFFAPDSVSPLIGASGAAAGIVGAYLLLHPRVRIWVLALGRIPLRIPAIFVLGAWIAFQVFMLASDPDNQISWAAHVGGAAAGMILILFMRRSGVPLFDRGMETAPARTVSQAGEPLSGKSQQGTTGSVPKAGKPVKWGR